MNRKLRSAWTRAYRTFFEVLAVTLPLDLALVDLHALAAVGIAIGKAAGGALIAFAWKMSEKK